MNLNEGEEENAFVRIHPHPSFPYSPSFISWQIRKRERVAAAAGVFLTPPLNASGFGKRRAHSALPPIPK